MHDIDYMQHAINLAYQGRFTTTPNPNVGCVIVLHNQIVGEGFHQKAGGPHAEIHALKVAGEKTKGATAYVTLEPCSHYGKTPPCANALIEAGIARVVIAMQDPNPLVAGKGIALLKAANIEVKVGVLTAQAEQLNVSFLKRMRTGMPYVRVKLGMSLDGRTAMASGESQWITGEASRRDVQLFRAQSSAILSSSQTVIMDDPLLTVRWDALPDEIKHNYPQSQLRQPLRVIIDSQARLTSNDNKKLWQQAGEICLVRTTSTAQHKQTENIKEMITGQAGTVDLCQLLQQLAKQGINSIWVEAGAKLSGAFLQQNLVDELIVYIAPKLLGQDARPLCQLEGLQQLKDAPEFQLVEVKQIENDVRIILKKA